MHVLYTSGLQVLAILLDMLEVHQCNLTTGLEYTYDLVDSLTSSCAVINIVDREISYYYVKCCSGKGILRISPS